MTKVAWASRNFWSCSYLPSSSVHLVITSNLLSCDTLFRQSIAASIMLDNAAEGSSLIVTDKDGDTILLLKDPLEKLKEWADSTPASDEDSDDESEPEDATSTATQNPASPAKQHDKPSTPSPEIHYQVFSTQLKNVSKYFRNIFTGNFSETVPDQTDGKYHIAAEDFHPKAMEYVLNIVHVKTRRLPRKMDLELLAHIAVLVDYYDMKEAVSFHAEIWAKAAAQKKFPETYCRDLVLRTFVARTFGDKKNFRRGAEIILQHSKGPLPGLGLPMLGLAGNFKLFTSKSMADLVQMCWTSIVARESRTCLIETACCRTSSRLGNGGARKNAERC